MNDEDGYLCHHQTPISGKAPGGAEDGLLSSSTWRPSGGGSLC